MELFSPILFSSPDSLIALPGLVRVALFNILSTCFCPERMYVVSEERQCESVTSALCFPTPSYTRVVSWDLSMNIDPPLELPYPPANPRHNSLPLENKQSSPFTVGPCFLSSSIRYSEYYYAGTHASLSMEIGSRDWSICVSSLNRVLTIYTEEV